MAVTLLKTVVGRRTQIMKRFHKQLREEKRYSWALPHRICKVFLKENAPKTAFKNFQSGKNQ